jgi:hypothetical protein
MLRRKAALFLFDYCELGFVPSSFWSILEAIGDVGDALRVFLDAIGCDPELVRQGDSAEREKAQEVIDLLVRAGDYFATLSPEVQSELGRRLRSGDYARVHEAAQFAASLKTISEVDDQQQVGGLLSEMPQRRRIGSS